MLNLFIVMLGGAVGAGIRYALGNALALRWGVIFPWGTLAVNLIGGLFMGLLAGSIARGHIGEGGRLLLGVGLLGGFTTFSAFGLDFVRLIDSGAIGPAMAYLTASVGGSIALTVLGMMLVRAV